MLSSRSGLLSRSALVVIATTLLATAAGAANLVKTYRDWSVFAHDEAQKKICFAASQPKESEPASANRDSVFFYISAWPKDGVKNEISVRLGYAVKKGSVVKLSVGNTAFELFAKDDKAFVADATQELKLIEAMKGGSVMKIEATSERGTTTSDSYSLMGISGALSGLAQQCP